VGVLVALSVGIITACLLVDPIIAQGATRFSGPTSSQPLALTADGHLLAVVNPDGNSVTIFSVTEASGKPDNNIKLAKLGVGKEPNGVAFLPDGKKAFVANTVSGTVSVIEQQGGLTFKVLGETVVGTEPYGVAVTPNGKKLYVTNARSNSVSVIDTASNRVIKTIQNVGIEPRGIAITNDGDADDNDETVYVTQFLSLPVPGKIDGQDDSKQAFVTVLSTATDSVITTVTLSPLADTGFKALGDAIARKAPPAAPQPADFKFKTGAYPNQLNNIGIKGDFAYVPNTGSSPNGPFRFDVNTHSLLGLINRNTNKEVGPPLNMHLAVAQQTNPDKFFHTIPWAIAFKNNADEGYVISAASNVVFKLAVDPTTGAASVQSDPLDPTRVLQVHVGKNPRGIVVNGTDTRAYVMNYVSRDVSVLDLTSAPEQVLSTLRSDNLPALGTLADKIQVGKELYNTSIGVFDPPSPGKPSIVKRMSKNGWGACAACHTPFGLSDNVVWIFDTGPRRTIPQHTDFAKQNHSIQRILNWSAVRDEEEDFELNIRNVSGGDGLIVLADGVTPDPDVNNFNPHANGNRRQLKVHGVNAWDAIKAFIQNGIRDPISPLSDTDPDVIAGRKLFVTAKCQTCHGGFQWTSARVRFTPPPNPALVVRAQLFSELRQVDTFDPTVLNEIRQNATPPLGADGFAPPSLLSIFAFPQTFLHNGAATSLGAVLENVQHRSIGTIGVDTLADPTDRAKLVKFLLSIDISTVAVF
jgi:YVTN family beta-propeller protein